MKRSRTPYWEVFYAGAERSLWDRVLALDASKLEYIQAKLDTSVMDARKASAVLVGGFRDAVVDWNSTAPEDLSGGFTALGHDFITVCPAARTQIQESTCKEEKL